MSAPSGTPFAALANQELQRSEDWQSVLAHFDFHEGFAFALLLMSNASLAPVCRADLEAHLAASGRHVVDLSPTTPDSLVEVCLSLRDYELPPDTGALWISAVVSEYDQAYSDWCKAFQLAFAGMNQLRNALQQRLATTVVFIAAPWAKSVIRDMAPDLWSIRRVVTGIKVATSERSVPTPLASSETSTLGSSRSSAPDPLFALREAEALRGVPGQEEVLARLLLRAGVGFLHREQLQEATGALLECLALREAASLSAADLAEARIPLGFAARRAGRLDEAERYFELTLQSLDEKQDWHLYADALSGLATTEREQGRISEALMHISKAERILEQHGELIEALEVAAIRGFFLQAIGDVSAALETQQLVFAMRSSLLGLDHPDTLKSMAVVESLIQMQGTGPSDGPIRHPARG